MIREVFVDWDSPGLTGDQIRAIAVAKGVAALSPGRGYLYKVEQRDGSGLVLAMPWGGRDKDGWPTVSPSGDFFSVRISADRKPIEIAGGA
jgi:hypothetical protein